MANYTIFSQYRTSKDVPWQKPIITPYVNLPLADICHAWGILWRYERLSRLWHHGYIRYKIEESTNGN